jgi:ribosomal protein L24
MSIAKIQTGDNVKVTSGNFKGTIGVVTKVVTSTARNGLIKKRASVSTIKKIVKYRKSQTFQGQKYPGQQFDTDRTVDISNLSLFDGKAISKSKVEVKDNKKVRVLKKTNAIVTKEKVLKTPKPKNEMLAK